MWQLVNTYGISPSYLAQGTAANIQNYFGLVWQVDAIPTPARGLAGPNYSFHDGEYKWFYTNHYETGQSATGASNPSSISISATAGAISRLADIANIGAVNPAAAREPDFFELLKAAVCAGSKAQTSMSPNTANTIGSNNATYPYYYQAMRDSNLDYSIIQLGANIIDQFKVDGYSTRIVFNDSSTAHEFRGVENLPLFVPGQLGNAETPDGKSRLAGDIIVEYRGRSTVTVIDRYVQGYGRRHDHGYSDHLESA